MSSVRLTDRVNELILRGEEIRKTCTTFSTMEFGDYVLSFSDREKLDQWKLSCLNIIDTIAGKKSIFYTSFPHKYVDYKPMTFAGAMSHYLSVLKALKEELDGAYLQGIESLVTRDMLSTILEEAKILMRAKYKDAAAVYCRVVLETAVKRFSDKNKITYAKNDKLGAISEKLKTRGLLTLPEWRQIQAWTDVGNSAAHGKFADYSEIDVQNMLNGIETFIDAKLR